MISRLAGRAGVWTLCRLNRSQSRRDCITQPGQSRRDCITQPGQSRRDCITQPGQSRRDYITQPSQSRRDWIIQPRVARRALPWELRRRESQPCKGCITAPTGSFRPPYRNLWPGSSSMPSSSPNSHTTNGMCGIERGEGDERCNPFRVECISALAPQGSARRATLGSVISSFQDRGPRRMSKLQGRAADCEPYLPARQSNHPSIHQSITPILHTSL